MNNQFLVGVMVFVYLCISAYWDIRYKRIPWCVQGMGVVFLCIYIVVQWGEIDAFYITAFLPGIFLLLLSFITKENIGYGDGISVLILGGMIGFRNCIWVLCISMLLLSVVGAVLLIVRRANRKSRIPYLPFLLMAESLLGIFRVL